MDRSKENFDYLSFQADKELKSVIRDGKQNQLHKF